jgi:hypothetical protein
MNIKTYLVHSWTVFGVSLIVSAFVSLLLNLIVHRASTVDWEKSFFFAILFGIIVPWIETRRTFGK